MADVKQTFEQSNGRERVSMTNGYIIDIDGTLLDGGTAIEGARDFLTLLARAGTPYQLVTNSISSPAVISGRLMNAGIDVASQNIRNPISAINSFLTVSKKKRCFVVGSPQEEEQVDGEVVLEHPEVVLLLDFEKKNYGFDVLQQIVEYAVAGIPVIAASGSRFYLRNGQRFIDTGSFVSLVEGVSGLSVEVFGKPTRRYFASAIEKLGCDPGSVVVIGDDWSTDIVGGQAVGTRTVLVRSGKYQANDELLCSPTLVVDRLLDVLGRGT